MGEQVGLTGATGFLGKAVAAALRDAPVDVLTLGRGPDQDVAFDLEAKSYPKTLPERLVHLAWSGLPRYDNPIHLQQVPRHLAFLEAAMDAGVRDLTITGTCFEYGMCDGLQHESHGAAPASNNLYAQGKDLLRREVAELAQRRDVRFKWVRVFYIFGTQPKSTLYTQLLQAIAEGAESFPMSPGDQVRDFIPVEEAAQQIAEIALQDAMHGIFNSCRGEGVTVQQFVESVLQQHEATLKLDLGYYPYSPFEPFAFWGDPTRMQQAREAFGRERRV